MRRAFCVALLALAAGCVKRVPTENTTIVFTAKRIHTLDPARPVAEALAWKAGALVAVGTKREVLAAAGSDVVVEDFPDSTIVPGFNDAHVELGLPLRVNDEERAAHLKSGLERWARQGLTEVQLFGVDLRTLRFLQSWDMLGVLPTRLYVVTKDDPELIVGLGPFIGRHVENRATQVSSPAHLGELSERGFQLSASVELLKGLSGRNRVEFPEGDVPEGLVSVVKPGKAGTAVGADGVSPLEVLAAHRDALPMMTRGAAFAAQSETKRGQLKAGFDADFVVLPVDPLSDAPEQVGAARVQVTVVGGVDVYRAK